MQTRPDLIPLFHRLADASAEAILEHFRNLESVDNKVAGAYDPVTEGDRAGERAIRAIINEVHPDHGILGEEYGAENLDADYVWVLDPVDGTRAFMCGLPIWGTLIGLTYKGKPIAGMMAQPFVGERFFSDGEVSRTIGPLGDRVLKTRSCERIEDAVLLSTDPVRHFQPEDKPHFDRVSSKVRLTRTGTDCYGYSMVAAGQADLVIEAGLQPYDVVALIPIIEAAGGVITTWEGEPADKGGRIVAAGCKTIHEAALALLASAS
ncbi:MAG: histidinol-phosphatase [Hyphomicrobiales bacterium]|nr:MAG: histidinol-phosphatase [Hyphomicrobiales bacterium]